MIHKLYRNSFVSRKRDRVSLLILLVLFVLALDARAQEGSQGNTTVFNGAQMTFFGAHTFMSGTGTQKGIIKTIRTAPFGVLAYGPVATYTGATNTTHVDGYVGKYGTTAFTFPIGNGTKLRTASISAPTSGDFKAAYWFESPNTATLPAGAPFPTANVGTGVSGVSNVEYWDVDGPSTVNLTLTWDAASDLNTLTAATIANLVIVGYNTANSRWESLGNGGGTTGTLAASGSIRANGVVPNTYSAFTFGVAIPVPDLTPTIESSSTILAAGASSSITVYIENIKPVETSSGVTVTITKPSAASGLTLTVTPSANWSITQTTTAYTLTLVGSIEGFGLREFAATLSRATGNAGTYNFTPVIANNSGGEINNINNRASVVITKN